MQHTPHRCPDFYAGEAGPNPAPTGPTAPTPTSPAARVAAELLTIPRNAARVYLAMLRLAAGDRCQASAQAIAAATAGDGDAPESERSVWRQQEALRRAGWISPATKEGRTIVHTIRLPNALPENGPEHTPTRHRTPEPTSLYAFCSAEDRLCKTLIVSGSVDPNTITTLSLPNVAPTAAVSLPVMAPSATAGTAATTGISAKPPTPPVFNQNTDIKTTTTPTARTQPGGGGSLALDDEENQADEADDIATDEEARITRRVVKAGGLRKRGTIDALARFVITAEMWELAMNDAFKSKAANPVPYAAQILLNRDSRRDYRAALAKQAAAAAAKAATQKTRQQAAAAAVTSAAAEKAAQDENDRLRAAATPDQLRTAIYKTIERIYAHGKKPLRDACERMLARWCKDSVKPAERAGVVCANLADPEVDISREHLTKLAREGVIAADVADELKTLISNQQKGTT